MTGQSPPPADSAVRAWAAMQAFTAAQDRDRHRELRAAFDFGRGKGRIAVLLTLADGPLTMGELADSLNVDPPNATVIIDQLENRGLVRRTPHPEGNRRKLVALTGTGREAAGQASEILARPPAAITGLAPEDLAALDRILTHLARTASAADDRVAGGEPARPVPPRRT